MQPGQPVFLRPADPILPEGEPGMEVEPKWGSKEENSGPRSRSDKDLGPKGEGASGALPGTRAKQSEVGRPVPPAHQPLSSP